MESLTCIAATLTPPVPWIRSQSPSLISLPLSPINAFQAVMPLQDKVAASSKLMASPILARQLWGNTPRVVMVPLTPCPREALIWGIRGSVVSSTSASEGSENFSGQRNVTTRSPGAKAALAPAWTTIPAPSDPGITPGFETWESFPCRCVSIFLWSQAPRYRGNRGMRVLP